MFGRRKIAALAAEFLGTGILTLLVLSVQRSTIGVPFFVAIAAGLTLTLLYFAVGNVSGGQFNPALTLALWTARKVTTVKAVLYIVVQLLGAWGAYGLYTYYANNSLQPIGGHYSLRVLIAEGVGTAIFSFGYAAALYQGFSTATRASVTGISYIVGVVAASAAAVGLINPALAFGVRAWVWTSFGPSYLFGPIIGALVGVNLYKYLFAGTSNQEPPLVTVAAATSISKSSTGEEVQTTTVVARKPRKNASKTVAASKATVKKTAVKRARKTK
jgi:aquaporin Z